MIIITPPSIHSPKCTSWVDSYVHCSQWWEYNSEQQDSSFIKPTFKLVGIGECGDRLEMKQIYKKISKNGNSYKKNMMIWEKVAEGGATLNWVISRASLRWHHVMSSSDVQTKYNLHCNKLDKIMSIKSKLIYAIKGILTISIGWLKIECIPKSKWNFKSSWYN